MIHTARSHGRIVATSVVVALEGALESADEGVSVGAAVALHHSRAVLCLREQLRQDVGTTMLGYLCMLTYWCISLIG